MNCLQITKRSSHRKREGIPDRWNHPLKPPDLELEGLQTVWTSES